MNRRKLLVLLLAVLSFTLVIPTLYLIDQGIELAWFGLGLTIFLIHLLENRIRGINLPPSMLFFGASRIIPLGVFSALIVGATILLTLDNMDEVDQKIKLAM